MELCICVSVGAGDREVFCGVGEAPGERIGKQKELSEAVAMSRKNRSVLKQLSGGGGGSGNKYTLVGPQHSRNAFISIKSPEKEAG